MKHLALLGVGAAAFWAILPQGPEISEFVSTEKMAYAVLPPEAIGLHGIKLIQWSPTGNYLLMVQKTPKLNPGQAVDAILGQLEVKSKEVLLVWSKATGKIQSFGTLEAVFGSADVGYWDYSMSSEGPTLPIEWFPGTDVGYFENQRESVDEGGRAHGPTVLRKIDLARGTLSDLALAGVREGVESDYETAASPNLGKLAVIQTCTLRAPEEGRVVASQDFRNYVWAVDASGLASKAILIGNGLARFEEWLEDGMTARIALFTIERSPKRTVKYLYFNVREGQMVEPANPKAYAPPSRLASIEIRATPTETSAGTVKTIHRALWLSATGPSDRPAVLLSSDADHACLSPIFDRVAILERGVVTIRALAPMNRSIFDEIAKREALELAKMVGTGLLIYGADYDDLLPSQAHFDEGVVDPYLKLNNYKGRFNYLFPGGALTANPPPNRTPLGYVSGPGGYALVFADGHAEWRTGTPPGGQEDASTDCDWIATGFEWVPSG